ncbi:BMC domain-containing protein [Raoultella ornithinolytica]|uniref:BMC domain-containing protein n=1 Tax=Raoultella ornithinolytica TaxID=54291 RepID=UPI0015DBD92F|nr:BMC domain-containing protein [Raoultella ornithinolytica]HAU5004750.1 BMC domain-containing protein [Raoultella ornithinolytica]
MSGQSLGLIETVGLTVAVEAADAAIKSANVELVGYELTKGSGLVTIKLTGEVGAMNAAVSAGVAAASRVGQVYAWKVIARTATGIDSLIASSQTCGTPPEPTVPAAECLPAAAEVPDATIAVVNITSPAQSASCLAFEESPGVELPASLAAEPDPTLVQPVGAEAEPQNESAVQATQEEKKTARTRAKNTRR